MSNILHIKDAYFEFPEKCKDDIGCMVTLLGIHLQQNKDVSEVMRVTLSITLSMRL